MNRIFPIIAGLCLLAITLWLELTDFRPIVHVIDRLESLAYDLQIQTRRLAHPSPTDTPVVIVDIDDKSIAKEGRWPWPRAKLATLIDVSDQLRRLEAEAAKLRAKYDTLRASIQSIL